MMYINQTYKYVPYEDGYPANTHYSASLPSVDQNYYCITGFFKCSGKIVKNKKGCNTSGEIYSFFHMLSFFHLFI